MQNLGRRHCWIVSAIVLVAPIAWLPCSAHADDNSVQHQFRAAEAQYENRSWKEAAAGFAEVLAILDKQKARVPESQRMRRRCLFALSNINRRLDRRKESLRFAISYSRAIEPLAGTDSFRDSRLKNELAIIDDYTKIGQYEPGQYEPARDRLLRLLADESEQMSPYWKLTFRIRLAVLHELLNDDQTAEVHWKQARADGHVMLRDHGQLLSTRDRGRLYAKLVVCSEALDEPQVCEQLLSDAFSLYQGAYQEVLKQRTLAQIAIQCRMRKDYDAFRKYARHASQCEVKIRDPRDEPRQLAANLKSQAVSFQREQQFEAAIDVTHSLMNLHRTWLGETHNRTIDTKTWQGTLYGMIGDFKNARLWLEESLEHRQRQSENPLPLARVLNNLAAVERASGNYVRARELFRRALQIREVHLNADDPDLATSLNNLGSVYMATNEYDDAIRLYRRVIAFCKRSGGKMRRLHSRALLNLATAYESQSQYDEAASFLRRASELNATEFNADTLQIVDHYNALAALARKQGELWKAHTFANGALELCQSHQHSQLPAAATAHNNLAIVYATWARRSQYKQTDMFFDLASSHWNQTLAIREHNDQQALAARTINYLGMIAWWQQQLDVAHEHFIRALAIQNRIKARPQDRYSTLCNLANVLHARGSDVDIDEAIEKLRTAIDLQDIPRSKSSSGETGRAMHYGRFEHAFEKIVQWNLERDAFDQAFLYAERSRNRTFLDQLRLAGIDLRTTLDTNTHQPLLDRERELREGLNSLRSETMSLAVNENSGKALTDLAAQLTKVRSDYARVWTEIRDASPYYRGLLTQKDKLITLDDFREEVLNADESRDSRRIMLFYYLGVSRSYVIVVHPEKEKCDFFPLKIPKSAGSALSIVLSSTENTSDDPERGIVGTVTSPKGQRRVKNSDEKLAIRGYLTRSLAEKLVAWYISQVRNKGFTGERGIVGTVESKKGERVTRPTAVLGDILLPRQLRKLIADQPAKSLIIVPDGPLHGLPFEALLISTDESPRFAIDELPPIAYAPSANILVSLSGRKKTDRSARSRLLTIGNPAYPQADNIAATNPETIRSAVESGRIRDAFLGVAGQLPLLPGTDAECRLVARNFTRNSERLATRLLGKDATERQVVDAIRGKGIVHIAAHGIVEQSHENLFGAIALTPPADATNVAREDGFLSYNEILLLPLADCELAVLSACRTNVGGQRKLEAGTSLAQAFLAAGARRVIASHWNVSDASTAEMMATLFDEIGQSLTNEESIDYATALQKARLKIKSHPRWAAPYYWAPFVLIGPAR